MLRDRLAAGFRRHGTNAARGYSNDTFVSDFRSRDRAQAPVEATQEKNPMNKVLISSSLAASAWLLIGCVDDEGPFERAGEEIDEATEDIRTQGEDTANQIDDAIDEARESAEDAADEVQDAID
jgi:hypothetical protein